MFNQYLTIKDVLFNNVLWENKVRNQSQIDIIYFQYLYVFQE